MRMKMSLVRMSSPAWIFGEGLKAPIRKRSLYLTRNDTLDRDIRFKYASVAHSSIETLALPHYEKLFRLHGLSLFICLFFLLTLFLLFRLFWNEQAMIHILATLSCLLSCPTKGVGTASCWPGCSFCVAEIGLSKEWWDEYISKTGRTLVFQWHRLLFVGHWKQRDITKYTTTKYMCIVKTIVLGHFIDNRELLWKLSTKI